LRNAREVLDRRQYYSQCSEWKGFRLDCVGLIARAWNLARGTVYTTGDLRNPRLNFSTPLDCTNLHAGDILVNDAHVVLFHHFTNDQHDEFVAWHASDYSIGHVEQTMHVAKMTAKTQAKPKIYECRRYRWMHEGPATPAPAAPPKPTGRSAASRSHH